MCTAVLLIALVGEIVGTELRAQDADRPRFDVAVVKAVNVPAAGGYNHQLTPQSVTMHAVSMGYCIRLAYGLRAQRPWELSGPSWIDPPTDFLYEISAKTDAPTSEDRIKLMLQTLLRERFQLSVHPEKRRLAAYALARTGSRPRMRQSESSRARKIKPGVGPYELVFEHVTMAELAQQLGPPMTARPVFDATGLTGSFDFTLDLGRYVLDPATGSPVLDARRMIDSEGATLRAVRDQLALTLRPDHGDFDVLIIDHVEKRPSGN
jgi:uncharacterized protein (TIGR03435 family)